MPMGKLAKTKMFQIPCKFAIYLRDFGSKMQQITRKTGLDCKTKNITPQKNKKSSPIVGCNAPGELRKSSGI
jgi:hypothetical protein